MRDWNVVVTVHEQHYRRCREVLGEFASVSKTPFYNVLVMRVEAPEPLFDWLNAIAHQFPQDVAGIARVVPATTVFDFQTPEEFEAALTHAAEPWIRRLAAATFHVRMHRRGFKGRLSSQHEEQLLDHHIVEATERQGAAARVSFDDPDWIIAVETVGPRAGFSAWSREQRARYPLLGLD